MSEGLSLGLVRCDSARGTVPGSCPLRPCPGTTSRDGRLRTQARAVLLDVRGVEHMAPHPLAEAVAVAADRVPRDVEVVVPLVVAVRVRGMRAAGRERDRIDDR